MTSSILPPRRLFAPCSPRTQAMASTTLDLPEPLGPTTHVMPGSNRSVVDDAKDLKPRRVRLFRCTLQAPWEGLREEGPVAGKAESQPSRDPPRQARNAPNRKGAGSPLAPLRWCFGLVVRSGERGLVLHDVGDRQRQHVVPQTLELGVRRLQPCYLMLEIPNPLAQAAHLGHDAHVRPHPYMTEQRLCHRWLPPRK